MEYLDVVKITPFATLPKRTSAYSAGLDLASAYDYSIPPMQRLLVKTDLKLKIPCNCYGRIAPRSGLALNNFIDVGAGVIDADYRGNICALLFNFSTNEFLIKRGDRIAQLIIERISMPIVREVEELPQTEREGKGFGSSGTKKIRLS